MSFVISLLLSITTAPGIAVAEPTALPKGALVRYGTPPAEADIQEGDTISSLVFTAKSDALFAGRRDGTLIVIDAATAKQIASVKAHEKEIVSIVRRGDKALLTASEDQTIKEWDAGGKAVKTFPKLPAPAWTMTISNSGKKLAIGLNTEENSLLVLDAVKGTPTGRLKGPSTIHQLAYAPDDLTLLVAGHEVLQMWNMVSSAVKLWQKGQELKDTITADSPFTSGCAFSPDEKYGASTVDSQMGGFVLLWDAKSGKGHKRIPIKSGHIHFAFSPDGTWFAVGGSEPEVVVYKTETGEKILDFAEPGRRVLSIAFSPDGKKLATGSIDGTVTIWDMSPLIGPKPELFPK